MKTTPLNQWHRESGANMAEFGGYEMPLWYETGVKTEHLAVLQGAGLFDTSHMACIEVVGSFAFDLINFTFTRDISSLGTGRCVYGAFLDPQGCCIDDAIVYRFSSHRFMICVNAGMGPTVSTHLASHATSKEVRVTDLSDRLAKVDIQGKDAARILSGLLKDPSAVFETLPYFSFKGDIDPAQPDQVSLASGTPLLISRSGYTGEFGFELFIDPGQVERLWKDLIRTGQPFGLIPCGLGARDSLRAGAGLPLSHQDIGPFPFVNHPWDFALPYSADKTNFTKSFVGADRLVDPDPRRFTYAFAGLSLKKVNASEAARVMDSQNQDIGRVLTCATDMGISWLDDRIVSINTPGLPSEMKIRGLACGFVMVDRPLAENTRLTLEEGKRRIEVKLVREIRPDRTARKAIKHFL